MSVLVSIAEHGSRVIKSHRVANEARQEDSTDGWKFVSSEGRQAEALVAHSGVGDEHRGGTHLVCQN